MSDLPVSAPTLAQGSIRLGLLSDTHGWLDPAIAKHFAGVSRILHAGDIGTSAVLEALEDIAPVTAVRGNVDGGALYNLPLEATVRVGPINVSILHIAGSPKRPHGIARDLVMRTRSKVLLVGHSHMWLVARFGRTMWFNPGAAGHHGFQTERTAALLDVAPDGGVQLWRIDLGPRGRRKGGADSD